jgi:hypothetical protein
MGEVLLIDYEELTTEAQRHREKENEKKFFRGKGILAVSGTERKRSSLQNGLYSKSNTV